MPRIDTRRFAVCEARFTLKLGTSRGSDATLSTCAFCSVVPVNAAIETGKWLQEQLGRPVPGMLVKAGDFPRPAPQAA